MTPQHTTLRISALYHARGMITQGELILIRDGEELRVGPGEWYRLRAGQTHAARFEVDTAEIEFWFGAAR